MESGMMRLTILATLVAIIPMQAGAGYFSGNELHALCASKAPEAVPLVAGYVAGVTDSLMSSHEMSPFVCVPPAASMGQVKDVVCSYLDKHPESRHGEASLETLSALVGVWSCLKKPAPAK